MTNEELFAGIDRVRTELVKVIRGKESAIELLLTAVLAGGHVLMEDVPGVGKTTLARTLAKAVDVDFKLVQFTPDLLPADILGASVFDPRTAEFLFHKGPVFTNILLADEINRASPRTQSALLEAMNEKQVSLDGNVYPLPDPFLVIATENPVEYFGTYPLPEAQLDRFALRLSLGYPDPDSELAMLNDRQLTDPIFQVRPCMKAGDLAESREMICRVKLEKTVASYMHQIVAATRSDDRIRLGASPRAFLTLARCAQACAWLRKRDFVTPDDVRHLAVPVLAHRLILKSEAGAGGEDAQEILTGLLRKIRIPA